MASKPLMRAFLNKEDGLASVMVYVTDYGDKCGSIEVTIRDCIHTVTLHQTIDSKRDAKAATYKFNKLKEACDKALEAIASMEAKK